MITPSLSPLQLPPVRPVFEKLAFRLAAPVRPVPLTGQTGRARGTPETLYMTLTLHQGDEVAQVRLEGFVAHFKALKARSHLCPLMGTFTLVNSLMLHPS
jgi:hypothetical protein